MNLSANLALRDLIVNKVNALKLTAKPDFHLILMR
jgi:hypothetical protein